MVIGRGHAETSDRPDDGVIALSREHVHGRVGTTGTQLIDHSASISCCHTKLCFYLNAMIGINLPLSLGRKGPQQHATGIGAVSSGRADQQRLASIDLVLACELRCPWEQVPFGSYRH